MTTTETRAGARRHPDEHADEADGRDQTPELRSERAPQGEGRNRLESDHGRTMISDAVVAKIAGVASREVTGVHDMGRGMSRTFGMLREHLPGGSSSPNMAQGVNVEVGERQAAVDIDIVVEYGASIPDVANGVRGNVMRRVQAMTGLEVVEVNIAVDDVALPEDRDEEARVQ